MRMILLILVGGLLLTFIVYLIKLQNSLEIDDSEGYHRILIDSIKVDNETSLYWFKYNTGVHGYVGDFISINKNSSQIDSAGALIKSFYIEQIDTFRNDSIFIYSSKNEYELINQSKYNIIFLTPKSYWDINKSQLLINLDSAMK